MPDYEDVPARRDSAEGYRAHIAAQLAAEDAVTELLRAHADEA